MNFSFAGCGFLGVYHMGVAACLQNNVPDLVDRCKFAGASAGAITCTWLLLHGDMGEAMEDTLAIVTSAKETPFGPLHPSFKVVDKLRQDFEKRLPPDAHIRCSGRLAISLTRVPDGKNVVVSHFRSRDDLIQALLCTSFVPIWSGFVPPEFRGERYIDGGLSDNLPVLDDHTVTISPFAGESDICPKDMSSCDIHMLLANTSIRFTQSNFYRMSKAFVPPTTDVLIKLCHQGYSDCLRFLEKNNLLSCRTHSSLRHSFSACDSAPRRRVRRSLSANRSSTFHRGPLRRAQTEGELQRPSAPVLTREAFRGRRRRHARSEHRFEDSLEESPNFGRNSTSSDASAESAVEFGCESADQFGAVGGNAATFFISSSRERMDFDDDDDDDGDYSASDDEDLDALDTQVCEYNDDVERLLRDYEESLNCPACSEVSRTASSVREAPDSVIKPLELAAERKKIDPGFSFLSLPLIPLEVVAGITKRVYSWIPREVSASISHGFSSAGTMFLTRVSEDPDVHPTARSLRQALSLTVHKPDEGDPGELEQAADVRLSARMALRGLTSLSRFSGVPQPTTPSPHPPSTSTPDSPPSVAILERILSKEPVPSLRERPEGASVDNLAEGFVASPSFSLRSSKSSSSASSSSKRKLNKREEILLAAFPTPSTSRSSSRCSLFSAEEEVDDSAVVETLAATKDLPIDRAQSFSDVEAPDSSLNGGSSFGDEEFIEGLRLQLSVELVKLSDCADASSVDDDVDNFLQLRRVNDLVDNISTYYYVLTQLESDSGTCQSPGTSLDASKTETFGTPSSEGFFASTPSDREPRLPLDARLRDLHQDTVYSDASSVNGATGCQDNAPERKSRRRRASFASLASLGLDWDYYAPNRYSDLEDETIESRRPFFIDDDEFEAMLPQSPQEAERTDRMAANSLFDHRFDESIGPTYPQFGSFFNSAPFSRQYPETPEIVRRIIEAPTPKIRRRSPTTPSVQPLSLPSPQAPPDGISGVFKSHSAPMMRAASQLSPGSTPTESVASSFKESLGSLSTTSSSSASKKNRVKRRGIRKTLAGIPGTRPLSAKTTSNGSAEGSSGVKQFFKRF